MKATKSKQVSTTTPAVAAKPETPKSRLLTMVMPKGVTLDRANADMATQGLVTNASLVTTFSRWELSELSLTDMVASLKESGTAVNNGDLKGAEQMLNAQAVSLNSIFAELARRSAMNVGEHMEAMERYMRLALKAQGQCRATLETLAAIKNPPVVFARQANISNGPQQVNNGVPTHFETNTRAHAPAQACGEIENQPTKLLEGTLNGGTTLDVGTTGAATRGHQELEAVGAVHRSKDPRRQGQG
ncbi:hypothetical protein [Hydrogenophaga sp. 2FB]|uniref:hypothetical protein n=1 Tax=Hydrogenophaga sp. 2FB TaxID=2502187 RepID=UPI0014851FA9|nr:hypothetical protein [Hydrogenophaga sp. 2FB]